MVLRRIKFALNRNPHFKLFLFVCFLSSTLISFLILQYKSNSSKQLTDDVFLLTAIDHRVDHDSFGVLVPASSKKKFIFTNGSNNMNSYAYVTLFCQDSDLPQIRVVVFSLKRSKTIFPIIVMCMPEISKHAKDELELLGAQTKDINPIDWKFVKSGNGNKMPSFQKRCRMSKLNLWKFTEFEKIVYLDSTLLIINVRTNLILEH